MQTPLAYQPEECFWMQDE